MSADFWAGYISGAVGILIGNPLDLIKVRLQAGSHITATQPSSYTSQFTSASSLIRGATAPILGYGALNALLFVTYNRTSDFLTETSTQPSLTTAFIAGAVGGLATWVVSTPTELIKCRAQMSTVPISSLQIARSVLKSEGLRGLYYGGTVTALRDSIGYGFYFWSYELGSRLMAPKDGSPMTPRAEAAKVLLCGGIAGVITWASVFPLDVIKTRVQTQVLSPTETAPLLGSLTNGPAAVVAEKARVGAVEMARQLYREEGAAVFFRGLGVCSVRAFVVNAAQWAVYEWILKELAPKTEAGNDLKHAI
jgi:solute carrier family 25 carnitine/acylcarnitine transporter 20/29